MDLNISKPDVNLGCGNCAQAEQTAAMMGAFEKELLTNPLVKNAKTVIPDSRCTTEETTVIGIPCITFRNNPKRTETVTIGTNILAEIDPINIPSLMDSLIYKEWKKGAIPI